MANLSIKSRLLVMLLGVSVISIAIVASLSYYASYNALRDSVFKQLTSLRAIKAQAVETYFNALELEAAGIAEGPAAQRAAADLIQAYRGLKDIDDNPEWDAQLETYYSEEFIPKLSKRVDFTFALDDPPNRVKDMLRNTALKTPYVAVEPPPKAHAVEFENDRIRYQAVLCLDNPRMYRKLIDNYTTRVCYAAQRAGLRLPLPTTLEYQFKEPPHATRDIEPAMTRLAGVAALAGLEQLQLRQLAEDADRLWFGAGEIVVKQGEMSEAVYVIDAGRAHTLYQDAAAEASEILQLVEGELFGETALTHGQPNAVSIVADTDLDVLRIPLTSLEPLLEVHPQTAHQFANLIDLRNNVLQRIIAAKT